MPLFDLFHSFANKAAADLVMPSQDTKAASWVSANLTIMPITVWLHNPVADTLDEAGRKIYGVSAANGYWLMAATESAVAAATFRAQPSFRIQATRPLVLTPWRDTITHTNSINPAAITVIGYSMYAGAGYGFDRP